MPPYINIHTHHPEPDTLSVQNVRLSSCDPEIPASGLFSAGIHPWDAAAAEEAWLNIFNSAASARLWAVGETGLDLRPAFAPRPVQERWLERQIEIANRIGKPLIIHNVQATQALQTLLGERAATRVVLHGFTGACETAREWLRRVPEVRFSFGPTTIRSPKTQEALRWIATEHPDRLFLETDDDPTLSIRDMYAFVAERTGREMDTLKRIIEQNFNALTTR